MRYWIVAFVALLAAVSVSTERAYAAGPSPQPVSVTIHVSPPGTQILVDGAYTGLAAGPAGKSDVAVTFPGPGTYYLTLVRQGHLPLTVKMKVPLWTKEQTATFTLDRVRWREWINLKAFGTFVVFIGLPLMVTFLIVVASVVFRRGEPWMPIGTNAFAFGLLGALLGLLVGLSRTPVVAGAVQAMFAFVTALAVYWFGVRGSIPVPAVGRFLDTQNLRTEMGAYLISLGLAFFPAMHLGGYSREASVFDSAMRGQYWGLQAAPPGDATAVITTTPTTLQPSARTTTQQSPDSNPKPPSPGVQDLADNGEHPSGPGISTPGTTTTGPQIVFVAQPLGIEPAHGRGFSLPDRFTKTPDPPAAQPH